jgi:hypothetical protein
MADGVTIERPDLGPDHPVREALSRPYSLAQWGEDLRHLADGVPTGFDALDAVHLQWLPGKLYGVAARPGGGKTAFLLEACLRYLEAHPDRHALFLSWEEPVAEVVLRLVLREDARQTTTNGGKAFSVPVLYRDTVRSFGRNPNGALVPGAAERLAAAARALEPTLARLHLVDGDALGHDIRGVLGEVAGWMRDAGTPRLGLVAVDYFQKLRGPGDGRFFSRQAELQLVADYLRRFAKGARLPASGAPDAPDPAHAVPVLVGAQVTRGQGEHPSGDSIREADDLLNDAAGVVALSWERTSAGDPNEEHRVLRVSVPKNRDGRSRPDEVARILWRPARGYLAPSALADAVGGTVTWGRIDTTADGKGKGKQKGGDTDPTPSGGVLV